MTRCRTVTVVVAVILSLAIGLGAGLSLGQRSMLTAADTELRNIQAMLVFNRILEGRQLQALMSRGCVSQAGDQISFHLDKDMELLSHHANLGLDAQARQYISDRDPAMLQSLKGFKSRYGKVWTEKACQPS
jgi:hypothetical protein